MSEEALLAEGELLPSESRTDRCLRVADVSERGAQIERSAERRCRRPDLFLGDACVLHVGLERQALRGGDRRVQPHATERIGVVSLGGEAAVLEAFDTLTELTADAQPRRHDAVRAIGKWRPRRRLQLCGSGCRGGGLCWLWRAGCLWLRAGDLLLRAVCWLLRSVCWLLRAVCWLLRSGSDRHCNECQKNDRRTCHTQLSLSKSLDKANCRWRRGRCVERASRSVSDADSKSRSVSRNAWMRRKITSARRRSASTNLFGARSHGTFLSICPARSRITPNAA